MKSVPIKTKTFKLLTALYNGEKITPAQAEKRFGVKNIRAEATRLRQKGYAVYTSRRKAGNGVVITEYELGRPSREIVALGYAARALGIKLAD